MGFCRGKSRRRRWSKLPESRASSAHHGGASRRRRRRCRRRGDDDARRLSERPGEEARPKYIEQVEFVSRAHRVGVDFRCRRVDRFVPRGHVDDGDDFCGADVDDERAVRFERVAREGKVGIRRDTFSITKVVLLFLCGVYVIREDGKAFLLDLVGRERTLFHGRDDHVCESSYLGDVASLVHQLFVIHGRLRRFRFVVEKRIIQVPILAVRVDAHYDCYNLFAILGDYFEHI